MAVPSTYVVLEEGGVGGWSLGRSSCTSLGGGASPTKTCMHAGTQGTSAHWSLSDDHRDTGPVAPPNTDGVNIAWRLPTYGVVA